jgi:hypothetical protein
MSKAKYFCESCGVPHRTTNVILFHGKYLCWRCRPKIQDVPMSKTLKTRKVFK